MLHAADRCERLQDAEDLFAQMRASDVGCNIGVYTSLINLNGRRGEVARARELFQDMRAAGIQPDVMAYSVLLNSFARHGEVAAADEAWREMLEAGVRPTTVAYVSLLNAFAEAGQPEEASERLGEMARHGLQPQITHWNVVLKACQRKPDADLALRELDKMRASGCRPNIASYSSVLWAVARHKGPQWEEEGDALRAAMAKDGIAPDGHFFEKRALIRLGALSTEDALASLKCPGGVDAKQIVAAAAELREARSEGLEPSPRFLRFERALETALSRAPNEKDDWIEVHSAEHGGYFWNRATGTTQWERPAAADIPVVQAS